MHFCPFFVHYSAISSPFVFLLSYFSLRFFAQAPPAPLLAALCYPVLSYAVLFLGCPHPRCFHLISETLRFGDFINLAHIHHPIPLGHIRAQRAILIYIARRTTRKTLHYIQVKINQRELLPHSFRIIPQIRIHPFAQYRHSRECQQPIPLLIHSEPFRSSLARLEVRPTHKPISPPKKMVKCF